MASTHSFTDAEKAEIETAYKEGSGTPAERRLKALWLYSRGSSYQEISECSGLAQSYISVQMRECRRVGVHAYINKLRRYRKRPGVRKYTFT